MGYGKTRSEALKIVEATIQKRNQGRGQHLVTPFLSFVSRHLIGLMDKPSQIYNCDESEMPLEHKQPRTLALKEAKKVRQ